MRCFIEKIFRGEWDELVHSQFVRFGKGNYSGRAVLSLRKNEKIKLGGSFEYADDFVIFASEFNMKFSGIIMSREKLELENEKKKAGIYVYEVSEISSEKINEIKDKAYHMLLDGEGEISLKIKKKLPKPGKSGGGKVNDKFCVIEADLRFWNRIKEAFFWDADGKKIKVVHDYHINELVMPKNEKDFEQIRIKTKRKGLLIRKIEVDGKLIEKQKEFEA